MMSYLILIRHGRSEWNDKGLWTGLADIPLDDDGRKEAEHTAECIKDLKIDAVFIPKLRRVRETIEIIINKLGLSVPFTEDIALDERDYGIYTGRNKWEVEKEIGEEEFKKLRRGWNYPIPQGESLKQVYDRIVPYYKKNIEPRLKEGKNVLIGGSGNSIRALVKYVENISDDKISEVEINTGEAYVYKINDKTGKVVSKEIRAANSKKV